jgi:hypothetical protein
MTQSESTEILIGQNLNFQNQNQLKMSQYYESAEEPDQYNEFYLNGDQTRDLQVRV